MKAKTENPRSDIDDLKKLVPRILTYKPLVELVNEFRRRILTLAAGLIPVEERLIRETGMPLPQWNELKAKSAASDRAEACGGYVVWDRRGKLLVFDINGKKRTAPEVRLPKSGVASSEDSKISPEVNIVRPLLSPPKKAKKESIVDAPKHTNVFDAIQRDGHTEDFFPRPASELLPMENPPGSWSKIEEMKERVRKGFEAFHEQDPDFEGRTGGNRERAQH